MSAYGKPIVPRFAVIGEPNEGKSTLVATLTEDDQAKIGPVAGTTTHLVPYEAKLGSEVIMHFSDTPGFQNTPEIYDWFERLPKDAVDLPKKFVETFQHRKGFEHDCELMRALIDSPDREIAMLYVVDGTKPISDEDRNQMVFLPRCCAKRVAIINLKSDETRYLPEWKKLISTLFGSYRVFNARNANFEQRMALLEDISSVIQDWKTPLRTIVQRYRENWDDRLANSANALMRMICDTVEAEVSVPTPKNPSDRHAVESRIKSKIEHRVRNLEQDYRETILKLFHHKKPLWKSEDAILLEGDIFSEEAWRFLGLSKENMLIAGTATGAVAGGTIDAAVGGASFMVGTLIGAGVGFVSTWMSAGKAIDISGPKILGKRFSFSSNHNMVGKIEVNSKLLWVLVDRALAYVHLTSKWSHGDRTYADSEVLAQNSQSLTNQWTKKERDIFSVWLGQMVKKNKDDKKFKKIEKDVFDLLMEKIKSLANEKVSSITDSK